MEMIMQTLMVRMTKLATVVVVLGVLVGALGSQASAQPRRGGHDGPRPPACTNGTGTIAGTVKDATGAAVADAHVGARPGAETTTAADGTYTLTGLCAGDYIVDAGKLGVGFGVYDANADGTPDKVTLTADALSATGIDITLVAGSGPPQCPGMGPGPRPTPPAACSGGTGSISGTVKDAAGNAVEGARVHAGPGGGEATTAADGTYTLTGLCAGDYRVEAGMRDVGFGVYDANADGKPDKVTLTDAANSATGIDITLQKPPAGPPHHR
jgi:hypothetical protein